MFGTDPEDGASQVKFKEYGTTLFLTPIILDGKESVETLFLLESGGFYLNVHTNRDPRWEPIGQMEFWSLIAELDEAEFDLVAEVIEDPYILGVVLIY